MKLRNKKTGEIVDFGYLQSDYISQLVLTTYENDKPEMYTYNSLAKLNDEWEDYEEPKEYWFIDYDGGIIPFSKMKDTATDKSMKQIGNYFKTREEAEKAVEKLKAWKRLKDKGFRFIDHIDRDSGQGMTRYEWDGYVNGEDLDLLFGGEE